MFFVYSRTSLIMEAFGLGELIIFASLSVADLNDSLKVTVILSSVHHSPYIYLLLMRIPRFKLKFFVKIPSITVGHSPNFPNLVRLTNFIRQVRRCSSALLKRCFPGRAYRHFSLLLPAFSKIWFPRVWGLGSLVTQEHNSNSLPFSVGQTRYSIRSWSMRLIDAY